MILVLLREGGDSVVRGLTKSDLVFDVADGAVQVGPHRYERGAVLGLISLDVRPGDDGLDLDLLIPKGVAPSDFRGRI